MCDTATAEEHPVAAVFRRNSTGLSSCANYVVLPATAIAALPLPLKQQLAHVIAYVQHATASWAWPTYAVQPEICSRVVDLTADQRAHVGLDIEADDLGGTHYRWRATGDALDAPERCSVRVPCPDPLLTTTQ